MTKYVDSDGLQTAFRLQKGYIDTQDAKKQNSFTAGTGLAFNDTGNVLYVTLDTTLFVLVESLPASPADGNENKIHLVKNTVTGGENDIYIEYLYVNSAWEKLGEYKTSIDLSPYAKITDLDAAKSRITDLETTVGSSSSGLVLQVNTNSNSISDLKTTVGSSTSGLVKDVADLQTAVAAIESLSETEITTIYNTVYNGSAS